MPEAQGGPSSSRKVLYTSENVCAMLETSFTDSVASDTDDQSSSDSESEFDLSDPEAGLAMDQIEFISQTEASSEQQSSSRDTYSLHSDHDSLLSGDGNNEEAFDSDFSTGDSAETSNVSRGCIIQQSRGRSTRQRGQSRQRRAARTRSKGRNVQRSRTHGTAQPDKPPLPVKNICVKTDAIKKDFTFDPVRPEGFHIPSEINASNPEDLFKLFFDKSIVEYICNSSNEYAELLKDTKPVMYKYYNNMSTDDFYKMVAIFIHLGYKKIPRYRLAWSMSSLCYDSFVAKVLNRNKFEALMTFLHVVDKEKESQLRDDKDKLLKVRPLYDHINNQCQKYYQPSNEISIDERMVRSKAHFSFKQYIRNKPTKWGFKLWCLCSASSGYTVKFSIYRGKTGEVTSGNGLSYDVVFRLMNEYLDQGYNLFVDNFYTSPTLASDLFARKTYLTGTLDRTRKGVPPEVIDCYKNLSSKHKHRGEGLYVRDGCIVYSTWKDTKCITVLSTKYPGYSDNTVKRNTKDTEGHHQKKDVPIPSPVYHYNKHMGGVDKSDQLIHYYNVLRSSKKYWKTLFFHFIDIAVVNSYIIHLETEENPLSHYHFEENLVRSLSGLIPESPRYTEVQRGICSSQCLLLEHYPLTLPQRSQCVYCKIIEKTTHFTTRQCKKCRIPLCFIERNCFLKWHEPSFTQKRKEWLRVRGATEITKTKRGRPTGSTKLKGKGKRKRKAW